MKRFVLAVLVLVLAAGCTPPALTTMSVSSTPDICGVGVCHYVPPNSYEAWGYETTTAVHGRTIEPEQGVFDFVPLDTYVRERQSIGVPLWLALQTVGKDAYGRPKAPDWLMAQGAIWHACSSTNREGMIAPWDAAYLEWLPTFLRAVNDHIAAQDAAYREAVAGIVIMSGGMYGEMQLSSCSMYDKLKTYYGLSDAAFNSQYEAGIKQVVDIYAAAFPSLPLILQAGYSATTAQGVVERAVIEYAVTTYPGRVLLKWNGLDPGAPGNSYYSSLFAGYADRGVRVGFEAGHPEAYKTGGQYDTSKFQQVFDVALASKASFMCYQGELLDAFYQVPGWQDFDAALKANCVQPVTPTVTPTATPTTALSQYEVGWYDKIWTDWQTPPRQPPSLTKLQGFADQGVTFVVAYNHGSAGTKEYLDEAQRVGIQVMVEIPRAWTGRSGPLRLDLIAWYANEHKDHPALWGWYTADEPYFNWLQADLKLDHWASPESLADIYATIRSVDGDSPVAIVTWAYPRTQYVGTADVQMIDWYPKDCKLPPAGTCAGSYDIGEFNFMVRTSPNIWRNGIAFAAQNGMDGFIAVAWGQDYANAAYPKEGMRNLTRNEFRYHAYSAIVQGASGLVFWKQEWASPSIKEMVYELTNELSQITLQMQTGHAFATSHGDILARHGSIGQAHTILAVNINGSDNAENVFPITAGKAIPDVRFQLPDGIRPAAVTVVGEGRTLPVGADGAFVDDFDRYQVHIYSFTWDATIPTPTAMVTPSPTATIPATSTPTPTSTSTPTVKPTLTPARTLTPTPSPTWPVTPIVTATPTPTDTPEPTATAIAVYLWGVCDPECHFYVVTPTPE